MKAEESVYALRNYTIKKQGDRFFVAATAIEGTHRWSKPTRAFNEPQRPSRESFSVSSSPGTVARMVKNDHD